jgi:hypothetical protein
MKCHKHRILEQVFQARFPSAYPEAIDPFQIPAAPAVMLKLWQGFVSMA